MVAVAHLCFCATIKFVSYIHTATVAQASTTTGSRTTARGGTSHEQTVDDGETIGLPAQLDEHQKAIVQTTKIKEMTVEPGLMHVPVDEVTTAKNSEQWVIIMDHPVEDDIRFFLPKPRTGWSDQYKLVRVLDWYGVTDETAYGTADPFALQQQSLYISYDNNADDWELVEPPSDPTFLERTSARLNAVNPGRYIPSVDRNVLTMYAFIQMGVWAGAALAAVTASVSASFIIAVVVPLITTVVGLAVTEP